MERKRVLIMTDSPKLHTGFARVGKEIWTYMKRTGKYDIQCIGWFHQDTNEEVTYPIISTKKDDRGIITQEDKYAHKSFPDIVEKFKPDMVWTLGDMWMVDHVATCPSRASFKWVGYFPIDGHPSPSKWGKIVENMDVAVAYGKYGMDVISKRAPKANLSYIYHGVDTKRFGPISKEEIAYARSNVIGVEPGKTLIGTVARNQPRKAIDKLFEAYFYVINGHYNTCQACGKITTFPYDLLTKKVTNNEKCKHCGSVDVFKGNKRDDIRLYVHGAISDCGWDLLDLQNDFDLGGKVLVNPALRVGVGVSEFTLNAIYNSIDIFTLPTRGEGFGLPILEAMSTGTPVVVTDYSAHPEWAVGCGELVPPAVLESEPMTNIRRAVIDIDVYVLSLIKLIDNKELREKYGKRGREVAESMDWSIICKQWEALVDSVLYPNGSAPSQIDAADLKYSLEAM